MVLVIRIMFCLGGQLYLQAYSASPPPLLLFVSACLIFFFPQAQNAAFTLQHRLYSLIMAFLGTLVECPSCSASISSLTRLDQHYLLVLNDSVLLPFSLQLNSKCSVLGLRDSFSESSTQPATYGEILAKQTQQGFS